MRVVLANSPCHVAKSMTGDEAAQLELLRLASARGKFAISVGGPQPQRRQNALEILQERDWIRLIDVTPIETAGTEGVVSRLPATAPGLAFLKRVGPGAMTRPTRDLETIERTDGPTPTAMWLLRAMLTLVVVPLALLAAIVWVGWLSVPAW